MRISLIVLVVFAIFGVFTGNVPSSFENNIDSVDATCACLHTGIEDDTCELNGNTYTAYIILCDDASLSDRPDIR